MFRLPVLRASITQKMKTRCLTRLCLLKELILRHLKRLKTPILPLIKIMLMIFIILFQGVDLAAFKLLNQDYAIDKNHVCCYY